MLIGAEGLIKLKSANVLVVGLGGVGAVAAEMICRSGVGNMTIIDGDRIHPSNRNRQIHALKSTEGLFKAEEVGKKLLLINPGIKLTIIQEYIKDDRMIEILEPGYDYVVDAIDTLSPKVFLIYHSIKRNYRIVSSMGAGGKFDPLQIIICDISETTDCSLARILRKRLHRLGIQNGFMAVFSPEVIDKARVIETDAEQNKKSIVGTISYMPAAFGIACASVVIRHIAGIAIK